MTNYKNIDEVTKGLESVQEGIENNSTKLLQIIHDEIEKGDANSVLNLGNLYYNGFGVEQDRDKAEYYYFISACLGFASAIMYVGNYYADVMRDQYKSLVWYVIGERKNYALSASCVWRVLMNMYMQNNNNYCYHLAIKSGLKAAKLGYDLRKKIPGVFFEEDVSFTKEEELEFKKLFFETYEKCRCEYEDKKNKIFLDPEIPESIKERIREVDIFKQDINLVITVAEPMFPNIECSVGVKNLYLCDNNSVQVGDVMYYQPLNYVPRLVKVLDVTHMPLSVIEEMDLDVANNIVWINHDVVKKSDKESLESVFDEIKQDVPFVEKFNKKSNNHIIETNRQYSTHDRIESIQDYHVIGVQFDGYKSGCYYYYGNNKIYNIGDRVLVPTGNNGNQEATVVFRKIYTQKSDIPYSGNLKWVIRKINDNGSKT